MLRYLHQHIAAALESTHIATLATCGPAGLQAHVVPCAASGILLYLLLPGTSDHLLNLEHEPAAVVATAEWQVSGRARVVAEADCPVSLLEAPGAPWSNVVVVQPRRVSIAQPEGWGAAETIDLEA